MNSIDKAIEKGQVEEMDEIDSRAIHSTYEGQNIFSIYFQRRNTEVLEKLYLQLDRYNQDRIMLEGEGRKKK